MKFAIELYAEKPVFIRDDSFIELALRSHGFIVEDSKGRDYYKNSNMVLSQRRVAGTARDSSYSIKDTVFGSEILQAKPGAYVVLTRDQIDDVALIIQTNLTLDPGLLKHEYGIRIINKKGKSFDIPLARPDIEIYWDGRGRFVVPITEFVNSKIVAIT